MSDSFNINTGGESFNVTVDGGTSTFNITLTNAATSSTTQNNSISPGGKFFFDGDDGSTYLTFNSATGRLEMYINDEKVQEW